MIALISGKVAVRRADHVVVDCGGVGYRLAVSAETLKHVPAVGLPVTLHTHLVVRDDALALYGFATEQERDLFLMLLAVQSVGPKVALAVLSAAPPRELLAAVAAGDVGRLQAAPGVGKRTAERIVVELSEKVGAALPEAAISIARGDDPRALARDALLGLGYTADRDRRAARRRPRRQHRGPDLARAAERAAVSAPAAAHPGPRGAAGDERELDRSLRPRRLEDFVGQEAIKDQLAVSIAAAASRGDALDHVLLAGPPGLGKTSLAQIVAAELEVPFVQTAGPALERKGDVAAFLTALEPRAVFFVDEIHRLPRALEETFYPAMEDGDCRSPSARAPGRAWSRCRCRRSR